MNKKTVQNFKKPEITAVNAFPLRFLAAWLYILLVQAQYIYKIQNKFDLHDLNNGKAVFYLCWDGVD